MIVRENYTCPLELVHDMLKGKWKMIILWLLRNGALSLSELEKKIDGITQKMLLQHLKELIEYEFVEKNTFEGYPLRVEYFLSKDKGKRILDAILIFQELGIDFMIENGKEEDLIKKGILPTKK